MIQTKGTGRAKRQEGFICSHGRIGRNSPQPSPFSQYVGCSPAAQKTITTVITRILILNLIRSLIIPPTRRVTATITGNMPIARPRGTAAIITDTGDTRP